MKKAIQAHIYGKVQGVWFRKYTREKALELGITGFVRNEPDGRVYVEAEGDPEAIEKFIHWLHQGSPMAKVENVELRTMPPKNFETFEIIY